MKIIIYHKSMSTSTHFLRFLNKSISICVIWQVLILIPGWNSSPTCFYCFYTFDVTLHQTVILHNQQGMTIQGQSLHCFHLVCYKGSFQTANGAYPLIKLGEDTLTVLTGPLGGEGMGPITHSLSKVLIYAHRETHWQGAVERDSRLGVCVSLHSED